MPTLIEIFLDPITLILLGLYAGLMIWEALFPARPLPKMKLWKLKGMTFFAAFFLFSTYFPFLTDPFLSQYQLIDLSNWGTLGGALAGIMLYELGTYIYHRSMHHFNFLWRGLHQMHHSSERLDTYSAFIFSPLDMLGWTLLGSICFALLIGLSPQAITVTLLVINFLAIFQHSNIKTPRWLGYLVQRPESHTYHHGKGIHKFNYADLPVLDILFGTFYNPNGFENETGFYLGASNRIGDMLLFKDVSRPPSVDTNEPQLTLSEKDDYFFNREGRNA